MTWEEYLKSLGVGDVEQATAPISTETATGVAQLMPGSLLPQNYQRLTPNQLGYWQSYVLPGLIPENVANEALQNYYQTSGVDPQTANLAPDTGRWLAWYQATQGKPYTGTDVTGTRYGGPAGEADWLAGYNYSEGCYPGAGMDCRAYQNKPDKTGMIFSTIVATVMTFGAATPAAAALGAAEAGAGMTAAEASLAAGAGGTAAQTALEATAAGTLADFTTVAAADGAITSVGSLLPNVSGAVGEQLQTWLTELGLEGAVPTTVTDAAGKAVLGAGKGALTSAISGGDPLKGALGGGVGGFAGGLVSGTAGSYLPDLIGKTGSNIVSSGLGGAAGGAASAAATGGDAGQGALRGGVTGLASSGTSALASGLGLGGETASALGNLGGQAAGLALRAPSGAVTGATPVSALSGGMTPTASTTGTSALASLLSSPADPGYSSPITGSTRYDEQGRPVGWNTASLRTSDATGSTNA